jgi:hypothetical protein
VVKSRIYAPNLLKSHKSKKIFEEKARRADGEQKGTLRPQAVGAPSVGECDERE